MNDFSKALDVTVSGLKAQAQRLRHVSENIANSDTPGYRRKTVSFETEFQSSMNAGQISPSNFTSTNDAFGNMENDDDVPF